MRERERESERERERERERARERVCVSVYVCVCVCVCVPYGAVVCAVDFQLKHCGFDPRRVRFHTSFFSFSISGWLPTAKCVCLCMSEYMWGKKERKKRIVTGHNQPLRAVWCSTRLLNSGGQFDQTCNLFGGAIPAQGLPYLRQ